MAPLLVEAPESAPEELATRPPRPLPALAPGTGAPPAGPSPLLPAAEPAPPAVALASERVARPSYVPDLPSVGRSGAESCPPRLLIQMKTAIQIWRLALRLDAVALRQPNREGRGRG